MKNKKQYKIFAWNIQQFAYNLSDTWGTKKWKISLRDILIMPKN